MTRSRLIAALLLVATIGGWMCLRTGKTVAAAERSDVTYGENTVEVATQRWATNAPRHWRTLVTKR